MPSLTGSVNRQIILLLGIERAFFFNRKVNRWQENSANDEQLVFFLMWYYKVYHAIYPGKVFLTFKAYGIASWVVVELSACSNRSKHRKFHENFKKNKNMHFGIILRYFFDQTFLEKAGSIVLDFYELSNKRNYLNIVQNCKKPKIGKILKCLILAFCWSY